MSMNVRQAAAIAFLVLGLVGIAAVSCASQEDRAEGGRPARSTRPDAGTQPGPETEPGPGGRVVRGPVEIRQGYQVTLGPWTWRFTTPESVDLFDLADRARSIFGIAV